MATIWKHRGCQFWMTSWYDADHRRRVRTTRLEHSPADMKQRRANELQARKLAVEYEEASRGNRSEAVLRRVFSEVMETTGTRQTMFERTDDYLKTWLERIEKTRSKGTYLRYKKTVDAFLKTLGKGAKKDLGDVTPADIQKFYDSRTSEGRRATTALIDLKALSSAFAIASKQGKISSNPCASIDTGSANKEKREPFTDDELRLILQHVKDTPWELPILFAAFMGLRLGDAISMKWSNVNLVEKTLTFRPQKTRGEREDHVLPLPAIVEACLLRIDCPDTGDAFLTPTLAKVKPSGRNGLSLQFKRILNAVGIDTLEIEADGQLGRAFNRKSFHSLRHSFVARLNRSGIEQDKRMLLAGHSDERSHARYTHDNVETLRSVIQSIPSIEY